MPKCIFVGCDQTAFYGIVYNQPRFCKAHADGSGSVKKKCVFGDCSNAISHGDICTRCNAVQLTIQSFREMRLGELTELIRKENVDQLRIDPANVRSAAQPAPLQTTPLPTTSLMTKRVLKPAVVPSARPPAPLPPTVPPKIKTSKIVRTPDEPKPVTTVSVPVVMKKRAQTPGRVRGVSEVKN